MIFYNKLASTFLRKRFCCNVFTMYHLCAAMKNFFIQGNFISQNRFFTMNLAPTWKKDCAIMWSRCTVLCAKTKMFFQKTTILISQNWFFTVSKVSLKKRLLQSAYDVLILRDKKSHVSYKPFSLRGSQQHIVGKLLHELWKKSRANLM